MTAATNVANLDILPVNAVLVVVAASEEVHVVEEWEAREVGLEVLATPVANLVISNGNALMQTISPATHVVEVDTFPVIAPRRDTMTENVIHVGNLVTSPRTALSHVLMKGLVVADVEKAATDVEIQITLLGSAPTVTRATCVAITATTLATSPLTALAPLRPQPEGIKSASHPVERAGYPR